MNDGGRAQRESDLISYYSNEIRDRQGRGLSDDRVRTRTSYLRKLDARVASVLELPFEDRTFEAGWTMSTLLHIADEDLDDALAEIVRVLRPGAPLGIGLWGDEVGGERVWQDDSGFGPGRFFSIRTDDAMQEALARHGAVEQWLSWRDGDSPMHYQWAVLRTPA